MKILHIISSLKIGGAEKALCNLLEKLSQKAPPPSTARGEEQRKALRLEPCGSGHSDTQIPGESVLEHHGAYFHDGPCVDILKSLGIPTYKISGLVYRYDFMAYHHLKKLITQIKPDLLHTSLWSANIMGRLLAHQFKLPLVCDLHGNCQHEGKFRNFLDQHTAHLATKTIAIATSVKDAYQTTIIGAIKDPALKRQALDRLAVIKNGIDAPALRTKAQQNPITRKELGIPTDAFVIGAVGRMEPIKSYDVLLKAFAVMSLQHFANNKPLKLCVVGDGSQLPELKNLAQQLGIDRHVIFTGSRTDAYRFYPIFDCFALSSKSEGLSIALLEALSFGLPIVTTHTQPTHEVVTSGQHGFVVPAGDPNLLADALTKLYTNPELIQAIQKANLALVGQSYDLQSVSTAYRDLFLGQKNYPV